MYRPKVIGEFYIPQKGGAILICNHVSYLDWMIINGLCKRPIRFIIYYKYAQIPLIKNLCKYANVISIAGEKEDRQIFESGFSKISEVLQSGQLLCLFPEGTLTKDGNLNIFRQGLERIVKKDPVPVIPLALIGMWGSLFSFKDGKALKKMPRRFRHFIKLKVGHPVSAQQVKVDLLRNRVSELLKDENLHVK